MAGGGLAPTGVAKERADQYQGRVTLYVVIACIVAAVGGSIFGYDIGISGGVTFMDDFLHDFFPSMYINKIWQCSSLVESCSRCWDRIRKPGYSIIPIRNGTNTSTRRPQHDVSVSNYARNLYSEHGKLWKSKA